MPSRADLDSLLLYDPARSRSTVNVWIARPTGPDEAALGKLFLIASINNPAHVNHQIVSILQDELRHQFYRPEPMTLDRRFEETLQGVNRRLHALIADGVNEWLAHAHLLAGAIQGNHLILSPVRGVHAYLLRGSRMHDILGLTDDAPPNPLRVFAHVVTGQLELNDRLLFCLPTLLDYFSLEKLRRTLLDHSPTEAARTLEQSLVDVDPSMSFGALMALVHDNPELAAAPLASHPAAVSGQRYAPQRSMSNLISTERATEKILAPSVWPAIRNMGHSLVRGLDRIMRTLILRQPPRRRLSSEHEQPASPRTETVQTAERSSIWPGVARFLRVAGRQSWLFLKSLPALGRRPRAQPPIPTTPFARPSSTVRLVDWWRQTTRDQRMVMAGVLAVVIVLFSLLARDADPRTVTPTNQSAVIEAELSRAEAALLYGGESVAREAVAVAEVKLSGLSTKRKSDRELRDQLTTRLRTVKKQLAHQVALSGGEQLVDLNSLRSGFKPRQLYLTTRHLVAYDPDLKIVAVIDRGTGQAQITSPTIDIGAIQTGTVVGTTVSFVTDRPGFVEFNPTTKIWKPFDATFPSDRPTIQALTTFQNRIYVLDRTGNRILRFGRGTSSYGTPVSWLRETADFGNTRDLTIDGSIYVLHDRGVVHEYFGGRKSSFALAPIDPVLSNPTRVWTNEDSTSLYLLDPDQRRIVAYDKEGGLEQQFSDSGWTDLRDTAVDEAGRVLFVVDGSRLLRYQLPTN